MLKPNLRGFLLNAAPPEAGMKQAITDNNLPCSPGMPVLWDGVIDSELFPH
jgi:hypothetical protein